MSGYVSRLDSLTADQEALLPVIRDRLIARGLSCDPADRDAAVAGVRKAYATAGLPAPKVFAR